MKLNQNTKKYSNKLIFFGIGFIVLIFNSLAVNGQNAEIKQGIQFGQFANTGTGGTITVSPNPSVDISSTGSITPLSSTTPPHQPAFLRVYFTTSDNHKSVTVSCDHTTTLKNGSKSITLTLNPYVSTRYPNPLWPTQNNLDIYIGGTLTVGSITSDPAGTYSGSFTVRYTLNTY
jgi:hypothetical protein